LRLHQTLCLFGSTLVVVAVIAAAGTFAAAGRNASTATDKPAVGRQLYRKFCGQCHAMKAARAVGFGSKKKSGLGLLGGPAFNELRVPYAISVRHVTQPTGGHEVVRKRITSKQLHTVAAFIAKVTRGNPIPALPTDG
jgi:mono/diheme cytochrome c family protein